MKVSVSSDIERLLKVYKTDFHEDFKLFCKILTGQLFKRYWFGFHLTMMESSSVVEVSNHSAGSYKTTEHPFKFIFELNGNTYETFSWAIYIYRSIPIGINKLPKFTS